MKTVEQAAVDKPFDSKSSEMAKDYRGEDINSKSVDDSIARLGYREGANLCFHQRLLAMVKI
jgi:hypothetical protein